jgi:hypothetical protein
MGRSYHTVVTAPGTAQGSTEKCNRHFSAYPKLHFFGDIVASKAARANFQGDGCTVNLGLYLFQIWPPNPAGAVIGMAYRIARNGVFSANIAGA